MNFLWNFILIKVKEVIHANHFFSLVYLFENVESLFSI